MTDTDPQEDRSPIVVDFETYYADDYSLKQKDMTTIGYILDSRFEVTGCAFATNERPEGYFVPGPQVGDHLRTLGIEKRAMVSHNIRFDGAILAWHYGIVPRLYIDTLGMARALIYYRTGSASLDSCAEFFGLETKGRGLANVRGMRQRQIAADPDLHAAFAAYAAQDARVALALFHRFAEQFPREEYAVLDMVARMAILPQIGLDTAVLEAHYAAQVARRERLVAEAADIIRACGMPVASDADVARALRSSDQFADILRTLGVTPPTKTSPATGRQTYAFAKTDKEFTSLAEDNPDIPQLEVLVHARLGSKSLQEETRAARFLSLGRLTWPATARAAMGGGLRYRNAPSLPPMVFPLKYSGAHTHRFSGEDSLNMQNLGRKSLLRRALKAPPGYKIVKVDASQIEARLNAYMAGQQSVLDLFRERKDPYASMASAIYMIPNITKESHPRERRVGKAAVLGLGYGMSSHRFVAMCWAQDNLVLPYELADRTVYVYRNDFAPCIVQSWKYMNGMLESVAAHATLDHSGPALALLHRVGCTADVAVEHEPDGRRVVTLRITLPNGLALVYHDLQYDVAAGNLTYRFGTVRKHIYGAKLVENVVQALARVVVMQAAVRVRYECGWNLLPVGQSHDELIYCAPDDLAPFLARVVRQEMSRSPEWARGGEIPLDAEGGIGDNYLDCV